LEIPVYKALGELFVKEGVDTVFALLDDAHTVFGRPDFATIARAVGIAAAPVNGLGQFDKLFADYQASDRAMLWDIQIDDRIPSRTFRRLYYGEN
jgi:thiamine pyrophosphate-dependent acetolactate synthase large subunit-like protein